ncbi:FIST C-terminal domain-containing protein [Winogradskyella undariae]|uniref:FIST signal transduction protein n=1 Tax=Winogradskyella undariae TaxID=1285465 RepID=UPI00156B00E1|nr:FIST N-terminal domain-containing protein [Winogradskyella undariae]NRR90099.1 FIST C-terminal domain-containing protein [Winogradskyella undariae]QNK76545.1 FIST C-terminal domain-containing protein [Winogradskyella sp. PAMC22761]
MKTIQLVKQKNKDWIYIGENKTLIKPLVLVFGDRYLLEGSTIYQEIQALFPDGHIVFGSSCAEISSNTVNEDSITITAIEFEKSQFLIKTSNVLNTDLDSFKTGRDLIKQLPSEGLKYVFVVSDGSFINGSELTKGMSASNKDNLLITGGLCGDDTRFEKTLASYNENPKEGEIVAIGFYGETLEVSFSIHGGWTPFGPERIVTKAKGNILYELDDLPALDLYKNYLGDKAKDLPGAALLYPMNVKSDEEEQSIVRSILNINEEEHSVVLAGDIKENSKVQLMMTNVDNIANASERAAKQALTNRKNKPELAFLVSCIGRKLVLDQRVEEEVEEVIEVLGEGATVSGFYSYGEIAPFHGETACQLHNQTMTITLMSE